MYKTDAFEIAPGGSRTSNLPLVNPGVVPRPLDLFDYKWVGPGPAVPAGMRARDENGSVIRTPFVPSFGAVV